MLTTDYGPKQFKKVRQLTPAAIEEIKKLGLNPDDYEPIDDNEFEVINPPEKKQGLASKAWEVANTPAYNIPHALGLTEEPVNLKMSNEEIASFLGKNVPADAIGVRGLGAVQRAANTVAEGIVNPIGAATGLGAFALAKAAPQIARVASGLFSGHMGYETGKGGVETYDKVKEGDYEGALEQGLATAATGAFALGAGKHALTKPAGTKILEPELVDPISGPAPKIPANRKLPRHDTIDVEAIKVEPKLLAEKSSAPTTTEARYSGLPIEKLKTEVSKTLTETAKKVSPYTRGDFSTYETSTRKQLVQERPFGLTPDKNGSIPTQSFVARMKRLVSDDEIKALEEKGFSKLIEGKEKINVRELDKWLKENGPKLEIKPLDAHGSLTEPSPEMLKFNELRHEFDTIGIESAGVGLWRRRGDTKLLDPETLTPELQVKLEKYEDLETFLKDQSVNTKITPSENQNSATRAYQDVNPKPLDQMPGAVDVITRFPKGEFTTPKKWGRGHHNESGHDAVSFSRGYLETTDNAIANTPGLELPPGEKVFNVFEQQSDWGQRVAKTKSELTPEDWKNKAELDRLDKEIDSIRTEREIALSKDFNRYLELVDKEKVLWDQLKDLQDNKLSGKIGKMINLEKLDDPALNHYNAIAAKANIEYAINNGARYVAVTDSRSVLLTEGHDAIAAKARKIDIRELKESRSGDTLLRSFGDDWPQGKYVEFNNTLYRIDKPEKNPREGDSEIAKELQPYGLGQTPYYIPQEKGMIQNYDNTIPNLYAKLTGDYNPKVVSFGPHKNAYLQGRIKHDVATEVGNFVESFDSKQEALAFIEANPGKNYIHIDNLRRDLVIKNPDGSLKTDYTARLYDLSKIIERRATGEPYSMYSSLYSFPANIPAIAQSMKRTAKDLAEWLRHGPVPAQIDRIRTSDTGNYVADNLVRTYEALRSYEGKFVNGLEKVFRDEFNIKEQLWGNKPHKDLEKLDQFLITRKRSRGNVKTSLVVPGTPTPGALSRDLQKIVEGIDFLLAETRRTQAKLGIPFASGHGDIDVNYYPETATSRSITLLKDYPNTAEAQQIKKDYIDYHTKITGSQGIGEARFREFLEAMRDPAEVNKASQFGPIDKVEGYGLPESMRERNPLKNLSKYFHRISRRFAYFEGIENNPIMREALGIKKDVHGRTTPVNQLLPNGKPVEYIRGNTKLEPILKDLENRYDMADLKAEAIGRFVKSNMLGPITGTKDFLSADTLGWQYANDPLNAVASTIAGYGNILRGASESVAAGVNKHNVGAIEFSDFATDGMAGILNQASNVSNRIWLRSLFEFYSRAKSYEQGRYLAMGALHRIRNGRGSKQSERFFQLFGDGVDMNGAIARGHFTPDEIADIASRYVERTQGTYDYRGLPRITQDGSIKAATSLARWSVEKTNRYLKDVVKPLLQGNPMPFINGTLGAIVSGLIMKEVVQLMTGRKDKAPTVKELDAMFDFTLDAPNTVELLPDFAAEAFYTTASLYDLAGHSGMLGNVANHTMKALKGDMAMPLIGDPTIEAAGQNFTLLFQGAKAFMNGENDVGAQFLREGLTRNIQAMRVIMYQLAEESQDRVEKSNAQRDLKTFRRLSGQSQPSLDISSSPFEGTMERKFKQTSDLEEAKELYNRLQDKYLRAGEPEKLESLKRNSIRWMPAETIQQNGREVPNPEFINYYNWVVKTQGPEAAVELITKHKKLKEANQYKNSLVPPVSRLQRTF